MENQGIYMQSTTGYSMMHMPLSLLPQSQKPWSIAVRNAYHTLYQIFHMGSSYIETGNIEAHCLQQYGNTIIMEAYSVVLLLTESAESKPLPLEWFEHTTTEFTTLLAVIQEHWTSAKNECVMGIARGSINMNQIFLDWLLILRFLTISIPYTVENMANPKNLLIQRFFMMLSRKEDESQPVFLQLLWVSIERLFKHGYRKWIIISGMMK